MGQEPSMLYFGGLVRTFDTARPEASWVLVNGGGVRDVGDGEPPAFPGTRVDLHGATLIPAFCDAHVHLTWLATALLGANLESCESGRDVLQVLQEWKGPGRGPEGEWVVGYGFDESRWSDRRLPTREDLDRVQSQRPVLLQRVCGHIGVVNSAAMRTLEVGPHTEASAGRLAEDDLYALNDRLRPSAAEIAAALPRVFETLHAHGITAVHDVTPPEMLGALQMARAAGRLHARVSCSIPTRYLNDDDALLDATARDIGTDDDLLRVLGIKIFVDGSLGAHTAFLRQPYADAPETHGVALHTREALADLARRAHAVGLQLMVHAIGDAAVDLALDALEPVLVGGNPRRHRLEHVEVTPPDLVTRLARSGVLVCAQPNFAGRWSMPGGMNEQRLGRNRLEHCNAYRSLHEAGIPLAFGSDCMPLGPAFGLRGAIEHPIAAQRLDAATALRFYTAESAQLVGGGERHGRIAPGLAADLVVLREGTLEVDATFFAGRQVYSA